MKITCGERFPEFTFDTAYKDGLNSLGVLKGKTVFWVLRYIGCTVCRYDVHKIAERYEEFKAKGAQVFVVMQSDKEHVRKDLESTGTVLPFEIITDPGQKIYDLLSIEAAPSKEGWRHSAHASFTYTGLYPVIEAGVDLGGREAWEYTVKRGKDQISLEHAGRGVPSVSEMTHSTGEPSPLRRFSVINEATALARHMVFSSKLSRTPPCRPSIVGRMPILG